MLKTGISRLKLRVFNMNVVYHYRNFTALQIMGKHFHESDEELTSYKLCWNSGTNLFICDTLDTTESQ